MKKIKMKRFGISQAVFYCFGIHIRGLTAGHEKADDKRDKT
jgi:hypothetical protein